MASDFSLIWRSCSSFDAVKSIALFAPIKAVLNWLLASEYLAPGVSVDCPPNAKESFNFSREDIHPSAEFKKLSSVEVCSL